MKTKDFLKAMKELCGDFENVEFMCNNKMVGDMVLYFHNGSIIEDTDDENADYILYSEKNDIYMNDEMCLDQEER